MRTPGTLAFAPIVDGDLVPDYPVKLARKGRTHPVPLIIGTNKNEAALFRWMKSPLMPITPEGHQGDVRRDRRRATRPAAAHEAQTRAHLPRPRKDARAWAWPATSVSGCRRSGSPTATAPSRRSTCTGSTWPRRCCDCCACGAAHATELPYVWGNLGADRKDPTFKLGGLKPGSAVSERIRTRWTNFATNGEPSGPAGEPQWRPYRARDRATLVIDKQRRGGRRPRRTAARAPGVTTS